MGQTVVNRDKDQDQSELNGELACVSVIRKMKNHSSNGSSGNNAKAISLTNKLITYTHTHTRINECDRMPTALCLTHVRSAKMKGERERI